MANTEQKKGVVFHVAFDGLSTEPRRVQISGTFATLLSAALDWVPEAARPSVDACALLFDNDMVPNEGMSMQTLLLDAPFIADAPYNQPIGVTVWGVRWLKPIPVAQDRVVIKAFAAFEKQPRSRRPPDSK